MSRRIIRIHQRTNRKFEAKKRGNDNGSILREINLRARRIQSLLDVLLSIFDSTSKSLSPRE
jgi:hypothetical protein